MYSSVILQKNVTLPRIKICESGAFHGTYKKLYFTNRESILGHADNVKLIFPVPIWFASFDEDFYSEPNNICTVRSSVYSVKQNVGPLVGLRITFGFILSNNSAGWFFSKFWIQVVCPFVCFRHWSRMRKIYKDKLCHIEYSLSLRLCRARICKRLMSTGIDSYSLAPWTFTNSGSVCMALRNRLSISGGSIG
jgi:hypothetical protein